MQVELKKIRLEANWTQEDVAHKAGLSLRAYSNIESGKDYKVSNLISVLIVLGKISIFEGLPGVIHDSLLDKFGNSVIDAYYKAKKLGRTPTVLDKLAYIGKHGMGALEFQPNTDLISPFKDPFELSRVVEAARKVLHNGDIDEVLPGIMESGGSAGGM